MSQQTSVRIEPTGSRRARVGSCALGLAFVLILTAWVGGASATPSGSAQWVATYNGPRSGNDGAVGMATSPDGARVYVTGTSGTRGAGSDNVTTIAYDASTGAEVWTRIFNPPVHGDDVARAIASSPTRDVVFVTGSSQLSGTTDDDFVTIAYDGATGDELWTQRYDGSFHGQDLPHAIAVSPDGTRVFVTGSTGVSFSDEDTVTVAYDAATGHKLWKRTWDDPDHQLNSGEEIAVSSDGSSVFVAGTIDGASVVETETLAYDAATGDTLWARRYSGLQFASPVALAAAPDGSSAYLLADTSGHGQNFTFATIRYDAASGDVQWQSRYHSEGDDDIPTSLAVSSDGSTVFSAGSSFRDSTGGIDYTAISYDASTGGRNWVRHYNGPGNDYDAITSVAVSPSGARLYVTGLSYSTSTNGDYGTVAWDTTTGDKAWVRRFDGAAGSDDRPVSVVADPDGSMVFVTGGSIGPGDDGGDFATVAYAA